jgi:hypothetical protein
MIVEFAQRGIAPPFGCQDLALDLLDFDSQNLDLEAPVLFASIPTRVSEVQRCRRTGNIS